MRAKPFATSLVQINARRVDDDAVHPSKRRTTQGGAPARPDGERGASRFCVKAAASWAISTGLGDGDAKIRGLLRRSRYAVSASGVSTKYSRATISRPSPPVMTWKLSPSFQRSAFNRQPSIRWKGCAAGAAAVARTVSASAASSERVKKRISALEPNVTSRAPLRARPYRRASQ